MFVQEVSEFRSKSVSNVLTTADNVNNIGEEEEFFGVLGRLIIAQKLLFFFPTNDLASLSRRMISCIYIHFKPRIA